ncbi:MAG: PASTA domain-containing protein [Bacteroidaceae bacterium]|nr:PASTA domain-containing protein [Bacteroidaceae bacterium]
MKAPIVWGNILAMIGVIALLIVSTMIFLNCYTRHGEKIEVPDVRGQKVEAALMRLEALGLEGIVTDTGYVTTKPPYIMLEQSIAPGRYVKSGRIITLTINGNGARPIAIPDLANNTSVREAEARLKTLGFMHIKHEYIDGDPDWLYAIKVKGKEVYKNQRVPIDLPITLVVGRNSSIEEESEDEELIEEFFTEAVDSI